MQTKKRAKPVKFGKAASTSNVADTKKEKLTKEVAEADINSEEAKEIKKIIEEKTHPHESESNSVENEESEASTSNVADANGEEDKDDELPEQEEATEDEPAEIRLSEEPESNSADAEEKKEEQMALENTEPTTEVEPEELHDKEEKETTDGEKTKSSAFDSLINEPVKKKHKKGFFGFFFLVAFITFLVGLALMAGVSYFYSSDKDKVFSFAPLQEPTPQPKADQPLAETATPTPEAVDLTAYAIRVLNGSGITGEAAKVRDELEDKGFTIASVGNAATSDYTKTIISAKESVDEEYLNELIKVLQTQYSVNSVVEDAPSSQTVDVVVTVGSDSAK